MATSASGSVWSGDPNDRTASSCLGFAGQGTGTPTQICVTFNWSFSWADTSNCVLTLSDLHFAQYTPGLLNSHYAWYLAVLDATGAQTMPPSVPSNAIQSWSWEYSFGGTGSTRESFSYFPGGTYSVNLGALEDLTFDDAGNIKIWIGGCSTYEVTSPVYPTSIAIELVADGDKPIEELLRYFPCAIRSGSSWLSCNRSGGKVQERVSGSWVDRDNAYKGSDNTVFIKSGNSWVKSALVGEE